MIFSLLILPPLTHCQSQDWASTITTEGCTTFHQHIVGSGIQTTTTAAAAIALQSPSIIVTRANQELDKQPRCRSRSLSVLLSSWQSSRHPSIHSSQRHISSECVATVSLWAHLQLSKDLPLQGNKTFSSSRPTTTPYKILGDGAAEDVTVVDTVQAYRAMIKSSAWYRNQMCHPET